MHLLKNNILVNAICKLQFVPLSAVQQYKVAQNGFEKQVVADFNEFYGTPATILFTQQEQKTKAGSQYDQQITLSYPGFEKENLPALYGLDQVEHLLKFEDNAGQKFIRCGLGIVWLKKSTNLSFALIWKLKTG